MLIRAEEGIFGLVPRSRADLEQLLGTSDLTALDPRLIPSSDITAISRQNPTVDGQVVIEAPDIDSNQSPEPLPENIVDASRLIAQGCSSGGAIAQEIGSLIVTGRGGIPTNPTDALSSRQVLLDWATLESLSPEAATTIAPPPEPDLVPPRPLLVEAQGLAQAEDGTVSLIAPAPVRAGQQLSAFTCSGEVMN